MSKFYTTLTFIFALVALVLVGILVGLRWTVGIDMTTPRFVITYWRLYLAEFIACIACTISAKLS